MADDAVSALRQPDDAASIALYLKSLPAQSRTISEDSGHPAMASTAFDFSPLPHTTLTATDPGYAAAERGRYLANLGCVSRHTPPGATSLGLDLTKAYAGGRSFGAGLQSSNLTPDPTGLSGWTIAEVTSLGGSGAYDLAITPSGSVYATGAAGNGLAVSQDAGMSFVPVNTAPVPSQHIALYAPSDSEIFATDSGGIVHFGN